jgi:hypothetical protein
MSQVARLCDRTLLLHKGRAVEEGSTSRLIERYHDLQNFGDDKGSCHYSNDVITYDWKLCGIPVKQGDSVKFKSGGNFEFEFSYAIPKEHVEVELAASISSSSGEIAGHANSNIAIKSGLKTSTKSKARIIIPDLWLGSEPKKLSVTLRDAYTNQILFWGHLFINIVPTDILHVPAPFYLPAQFHVDKLDE